MKNYIWISLLLITSTLAAQERASIFENEQQLTWIGKAAVGGYAPEGTLNIASAEITYATNCIISLSIIVDMESLDQENSQLKEHLLDKDFFHVKKYPTAQFELKEQAFFVDDNVNLKGTLTIKKVTKTEEFVASVHISEEQITLTIYETLDRTDYGINYNSPSVFKKMKENLIADEFVLKGTLVFKK